MPPDGFVTAVLSLDAIAAGVVIAGYLEKKS
jgi:hypothetical protein